MPLSQLHLTFHPCSPLLAHTLERNIGKFFVCYDKSDGLLRKNDVGLKLQRIIPCQLLRCIDRARYLVNIGSDHGIGHLFFFFFFWLYRTGLTTQYKRGQKGWCRGSNNPQMRPLLWAERSMWLMHNIIKSKRNRKNLCQQLHSCPSSRTK